MPSFHLTVAMEKTYKFLQDVARYYLGISPDMRDTLLIFPNKRPILFMKRYFKRNAEGPFIMPKMQTLGAFIGEMSEENEASAIQQIFTLYDAYCEVSEQHNQTPTTFDRFRFWGGMMLNDFNDVDLQLVSPQDVFINVKRLEEIQTDYLSEEQRKVAMEIWGYDIYEAFEGFKNSNPKDGNGVAYQQYVKLTEMLYPIYETFNKYLKEQGLTTRGKIARNAVEKIKELIETPGALKKRIAFVGFGTLTAFERSLFTTLRNRWQTDFFWDIPDMLKRDLPENMNRYRSPLSKYMGRLVHDFPMPAGFSPSTSDSLPQIKIIGVPSNSLQTKVTGNILTELNDDGCISTRRADNTAVVLPNSSLLIPLLHSIEVSPVNVTMGVPIRNTPFATLLSLIIGLNLTSSTDIEGNTVYLTQKIVRILTHPSLTTLMPVATTHLREFLKKRGRIVTSYKDIKDETPELAFIFDPIAEGNNAAEARVFINGLIDGLLYLIEQWTSLNDSARQKTSALHEYRVLTAMRNAVDNLIDIIEQHPRFHTLQDINRLSFFRLIEKQLNRELINFSGSPLVGVQIMGALETRSLDFDNVIMLSMNEKTFPPKEFVRSLLPASIRKGFGLSTSEEAELEYAWIYANLLSRCNRAYLLFDSAAETSGKGGMSRYLFQSLYIYNRPQPQLLELVPGGALKAPETISIEKTPKIMAELERFKAGGDRQLSVSALEKFGECPLKFYLAQVMGIDEPETDDESISPAVIGTVVHEVMQQIYREIKDKRNGIVDSTYEISDEDIRTKLRESFDRNWYDGQIEKTGIMPYEVKMQIDQWAPLIREIMNRETHRAEGAYNVEACELSTFSITGKKCFDWQLTPDLSVRFKFFIDRVDRVNENTLRFVDYKTGNAESTSVKSLNDLFWESSEDGKNAHPNKAMFQLLTYAHAYNHLMQSVGKPFDGDIRLEITKVLDPTTTVGKKLKIGIGKKNEFSSYKDVAAEGFYEKLGEFVSRIFDPAIPFNQTEETDTVCIYCQFKNICHRNPEMD